MKALSLKQPWAELILQGKKTIETRKWRTNFRGKFLIHASKTPDKVTMARFGFSSLPSGCIVGKAELVDVKEYKTKREFDADFNKHQAKVDKYDKKRYGYLLRNVKRLKPKPYKGMLNFFEVKWKKQ